MVSYLRIYECLYCNVRFESQDALDRHIKKEHSIEKFVEDTLL